MSRIWRGYWWRENYNPLHFLDGSDGKESVCNAGAIGDSIRSLGWKIPWRKVPYPFFSRSSQPGNRTRVSCITGGCFTNWAIREDLLQGSRALFNTDSLGGGKCGDNNEVRTDGKTNNFNQLMGIPVSLWWLWSAIFLQVKTLSQKLVSVNQPRCLQLYMAQEQRNYGTKQFFSDTFKLLEQTFHTYEITVWPYCFIWKGQH